MEPLQESGESDSGKGRTDTGMNAPPPWAGADNMEVMRTKWDFPNLLFL